MNDESITLDFECAKCGRPLEVTHEYPGKVKAEPCRFCIEDAETQYEEGYTDGEQAAEDRMKQEKEDASS